MGVLMRRDTRELPSSLCQVRTHKRQLPANQGDSPHGKPNLDSTRASTSDLQSHQLKKKKKRKKNSVV